MKLRMGCVTISYNQGDYLRECIESVTCQDPSRIDYVIVDAGSTDSSRETIKEYEGRGKFHTVILEPDEGPSDGLNKGFSVLNQVDILAYMNSDDRFLPGAIDYALSFFEENPGVDVLTGAGGILDKRGAMSRRKRLSTETKASRFFNGTMLVIQQATFFRKSAFEQTNRFNKKNKTCWDTELLIDLFLSGARFKMVEKLLGGYRVYPGTITSDLQVNGFNPRYLADQKRIEDKLLAANYRMPNRLVKELSYWAYRINPIRRIKEFTVC